MGCIDNLLIDKAVLEDAQFSRKKLLCTWIDVKKVFDSIDQNWLNFCLQIHSILTKIAQFITGTHQMEPARILSQSLALLTWDI